MATVPVALAQAVKAIPKDILERDLMWWLNAMGVVRHGEAEDFIVLVAEYPCFCNSLEDKESVCVSCHAQVIVNRRIFAMRKVSHAPGYL